jgi:hypothetical protein
VSILHARRAASRFPICASSGYSRPSEHCLMGAVKPRVYIVTGFLSCTVRYRQRRILPCPTPAPKFEEIFWVKQTTFEIHESVYFKQNSSILVGTGATRNYLRALRYLLPRAFSVGCRAVREVRLPVSTCLLSMPHIFCCPWVVAEMVLPS